MSRSRFDSFNSFIRRFYKAIIIAWIVALVGSAALVPSFFAGVSYDVTAFASFGGPNNAESVVAQNIINVQFPNMNGAGNNSIILVIQTNGSSVYSDEIRNAVFQLNRTLASDPNMANYTGMSGLYSAERDALNSTVPSFISGVASLASNVSTVNQAVYSLAQNMTALSSGLFQFYSGVNQTSQLIYGIPATFVGIWTTINASMGGMANAAVINQQANATFYSTTGALGGDQQSLGYYAAFFQYWNNSFQSALTVYYTPLQREALAVNGAAGQLTTNPQLDNSTKALITTVATGLNVTSWNQSSAISNLAVNAFANQTYSSLSSLGIQPSDYVNLMRVLFNLGPSPSTAALLGLVQPLIVNGFSASSSLSGLGFSVGDLVGNASLLGPSPNATAIWSVATRFFVDATASAFSDSPLFAVNSTSLYNLLSGLSVTSTPSQIDAALNSVIASQSVSDYPLTLAGALTQNLVGPKNDTMIVALGFPRRSTAEPSSV